MLPACPSRCPGVAEQPLAEVGVAVRAAVGHWPAQPQFLCPACQHHGCLSVSVFPRRRMWRGDAPAAPCLHGHSTQQSKACCPSVATSGAHRGTAGLSCHAVCLAQNARWHSCCPAPPHDEVGMSRHQAGQRSALNSLLAPCPGFAAERLSRRRVLRKRSIWHEPSTMRTQEHARRCLLLRALSQRSSSRSSRSRSSSRQSRSGMCSSRRNWQPPRKWQ